MVSRFTLDTNILVYAADRTGDPAKRARALYLLAFAARSGQPLALQALNEFCHVITRKKLLTRDEARASALEHMRTFDVIASSASDTLAALELHATAQYSYWDSLIVATAVRSGCSIVFSEDMHDGHSVNGTDIVNPFRRTQDELRTLLQH